MCCYRLSAGVVCGREAVTTRLVPVRQSPPIEDRLEVHLCRWHASAVDVFEWGHDMRFTNAG
jgi:hypothetical protein